MSDLLKSYESGLKRLLELLGKDHPDYNLALTFQSRLSENIEQTRLFRDTPDRKSERAEIIYALNEFTSPLIGQSFSELCEVHDPPPVKPHKESPDRNSSIFHSAYRESVVSIERQIDTVNPDTFTDDALAIYIGHINIVITWIRDHCKDEDLKAEKEAVLVSLREARIKLGVAIEEYKKRGRTNKFYDYVEASRSYLERALKRW